MQKGDYNKAFMDASNKAKKTKPTFLQLWIIAESCRKRKSLGEFKTLVESLESLYGKTKETLFVRVKLESLTFAIAYSGRDQVKADAARQQLRALIREAEPHMKKCLPLSLLIGSLYIGDTTQKRAIADRLILENPGISDLKLWNARAFLNGSFGMRLGKDGKVVVGKNGRPVVTSYPDSPDIKKAEELLQAYGREVSNDPRTTFYQVRLLSMKAYFVTQEEKETAKLTQQAQKLMDTFLSAPGMPKPMIEVGRRFKTAPYPGTFILLPTE